MTNKDTAAVEQLCAENARAWKLINDAEALIVRQREARERAESLADLWESRCRGAEGETGMTPDVDSIMALADAFRKSGSVEDENALRAAVEQLVRQNLQRGNVIGRITAHLLGNKNNVTDEDVVIAAAEVGRELQGARERIKVAEAACLQAQEAAKVLLAKGEMLAAVVQGAREEFVRVPYGASHEDVAAINDWHRMADEALEEWK